jgi:hypothetical protein
MKSVNVNLNPKNSKHDGFSKKLTLLIKDWLESSSFHGVDKLIRTKFILVKITWLVLILSSSCLCVFFVGRSVQDYLDHQVTTEIRIFDKLKIDFPAITICSRNPFSSRDSVQYLKLIAMSNNLSSIFDEVFSFDSKLSTPEKISKLKQLEKVALINVYSKNMSLNERTKFSPPLDELIIDCRFSGIKCKSADFEQVYISNYGNCFRFNSGFDLNGKETERKVISRPGKYSGLTLELYTGLPNELSKIATKKDYYVSVHSTGDFYLKKIEAPPGLETNVIVKKSVYEQLDRPSDS